jgi:hypothetical protein
LAEPRECIEHRGIWNLSSKRFDHRGRSGGKNGTSISTRLHEPSCGAARKLEPIRLAEALGEHSLALWNAGRREDSFAAWEDGVETLLDARDQKPSWTQTFLAFLHVAGFFSAISLWGEITDPNFAVPKAGHFLAVANMEVEKYQPIQDGLLLLRTAMFAEGIGNAAASAKWATRAFTKAHQQSGTGLLDAFGWLPIPHFIETGTYDKAIEFAYAFSKRKPPDETSLKTFELKEQDRKRVEEIYSEPRILDRALLFCLVPIALRLATLRFDRDIAGELAAVTSALDQVSAEIDNPWKESAQFLRSVFSGEKAWRKWHDDMELLYAANRATLGLLASLASVLEAPLPQSLVSQIGLARNLGQVFKISPSIRANFVAPFVTRYWQEATSKESVQFRTSATYTQRAFSEEASHPPLVRVKKLLARMVFCIGLTVSEDLRAWLEEDF